jgi:protein-tyrosine phosphatase
MDRVLRLERVRNARELGGLPTADGRRVAAGCLFRSGSLHEMTARDRAALESRGVRIVVDLRSPFEQERQSYEWPADGKVAAPLADDEVVAGIFRRFEAGELSELDVEDWWNLTGVFDIPIQHRSSMGTIFATLLEAGPGEGVLFHCTGGKDRTGVAAAFVLSALGVTGEAIVEDFLMTNAEAAERAAEFIGWMKLATGRAMSPETAYWLAGVKREWLETLLQRTATRYRSVAGYLREELGIGAPELTALQGRFLEPSEA